MPSHDLATKRRAWADLRPHPDNPRNGDTDAIAESLRMNGQYRPIVTTPDGTILAGNHTYAAAGELGWDALDCVVLDLDPGSPQAKRIMLADNRTADLGRYDDGLLEGLLAALDAADGGLLGTGYDDDDLTSLRHRLDEYDDHKDDLSDLKNKPAVRRPFPVRPIVSQNPSAIAVTFAAAHLGFDQGVISVQHRSWLLLQERHPRTFGTRRLAFLDNDWKDYDHGLHVEAAAATKPRMATTRDLLTKEQADAAGIEYLPLDKVLGYAADLAPHVDDLILIPKYDCIADIPDQIDGKRVVLGYSVPSSYGATPVDPQRFAGRPVHLLGGSWAQQRALLHALGSDVVAFDNNNFMKIARVGGSLYRQDGTMQDVGDFGYPNLQQPGVYLVATILSLFAMATDLLAWNGGSVGDAQPLAAQDEGGSDARE